MDENNNVVDKSVLDYQEPEAPQGRGEARLEDIWGYFPRVTTTPTWTPRTFRESIALDTSANKLYYYDFTNTEWKALANFGGYTAGYNVSIDTATDPDTLHAGRIATLTAGEAISADDAVVIGARPTATTVSNFTGYAVKKDLSSAAFPSDNGLWAQTFTVTNEYLHKIECEVEQTDESTVTYQIQIQETTAGAPNSTVVASSTASFQQTDPVGGGDGQYTALFDYSSAPLQLTVGGVYAIVMRFSQNTGASVPRWAYTNGDTYASGKAYTRSAGSWSQSGGGSDDFSFKTYESPTKEGQIHRSSAASNNSKANNFIGFAPSAISSGATGVVVYMGIVDFLSGLTPGATYFLSDTAGQISTSAGSQSRKIGIALSTTSLLIKPDNP